MSCGSRINRAAEAALQGGITLLTSKKSFYIGAAAAGALISGLTLGQFLRERTTSFGAAVQPVSRLAAQSESPKIQRLPGLKKITPSSPYQLTGQHCGRCDMDPGRKAGPWYLIGGQAYCHGCARRQAQKEGMEIVSPEPSMSLATESSASPNLTGRRITLKPGWVSTGIVKNVEGYIVFDGRREKATGLVIVPEIKINPNGQASINTTRWYINYDRLNKAVAGPYESVKQAKSIAAVLANFDWNRPMEEFSKEEVQIIQRALVAYRVEVEEEKLLKS